MALQGTALINANGSLLSHGTVEKPTDRALILDVVAAIKDYVFLAMF